MAAIRVLRRAGDAALEEATQPIVLGGKMEAQTLELKQQYSYTCHQE